MGLLELVEQYQAIGTASHRLGEPPPLLEAHVARIGADQAIARGFGGELGHVETYHRPRAGEQVIRQGLGQLRLSDSRGTGEEKDRSRAIGVGQAGLRAPDPVADGLERFALAENARVQSRFQLGQQGLSVAVQPVDRDPGPFGDHPGHILGADLRYCFSVVIRRRAQPHVGSDLVEQADIARGRAHIGEEAARVAHDRVEAGGLELEPVVLLVGGRDAAQDLHRLSRRGFLDPHRLEAPT